MFKPNISTVNALIRITIGFAMVGFATATLVRKPWSFLPKVAVVLGSMKVAEGIVKFCPITEAFKLSRYMNLPFKNNEKSSKSHENETPNDLHNVFNKSDDSTSSLHAVKTNETETAQAHNNNYDASDAKIEAKIASAILGVK